MSGLDWFIARRYLASRKKGRFLSFITWIALGGITVGVTALIVVLGVMNGMQTELHDRILGSTPHVVVLEHGPSLRMGGWRETIDEVQSVDGVVAAAPFILSKVAILRDEEYAQAADLYGIDPEASGLAVTDMEQEIQEGIHSLRPPESGLPPVLLGSRLAERIQAMPGDTVLAVSLENIRTDPFGSLRPALRQFEVTGTFTTGMYEYDLSNMYAPLDVVQGLLGIQDTDQVSGIGVRITDPWEASAVGETIRDRLGFPYFVESWITTHQSLFSALKLEKLAMGLILSLIVLVAAFNIVSTLVMVVVDRTREIGILKSMGMTDRQVLRIFVLQGLSIGVIGTALGTLFGFILGWALDRFELITIPADIYFIDRLPIAISPWDVLLIAGISLLISLLATVYPSLQASRLQPVEAIRHE